MEQYIDIKKSSIPYRFEMELRGEIFEFEIRYNDDYDFFSLILYRDDEYLAEEKLMYGRKLFDGIVDRDARFPKVDIIPNDPSGFQKKITHQNFNETVFLEVIE